jgi:hypothetical protein
MLLFILILEEEEGCSLARMESGRETWESRLVGRREADDG